MKRIFVPTSSGSDWQRLLAKPKLHWKRGRSAMSAAACWEAQHPKLPTDISDALEASGFAELGGLELLAAIPEWQVELPGGDRASQTDILALARNESGLVVLGVEAKVDEPFGPTLGEKRNGASSGQLARIAYLEHELGCKGPMPDSVRYQLLHRTVSALLTARAFHAHMAVMLVQSFSPTSQWRDDFDAFAIALAAKEMTPDVFKVRTTNGPQLFIGWCCGDQRFLLQELPGIL